MIEAALFFIFAFGILAVASVLAGKVFEGVECPRCGRFPKSLRLDSLCHICRDPKLAYIWIGVV